MACLFKMKRYHVILVRGSEIGQERNRQRGKEGREGRKRGERERNKQRREVRGGGGREIGREWDL